MAPILGIVASQNYSRITGSYESIATIVPSGSTNTVTFSSIPQTYKHLQLRLLQKDNYSANANASNMRFNGDSTTNYWVHRMYGNGTSASADNYQSTSLGDLYASANSGASVFGVNITDVLDYTNSNKYKTVRTLCGYDSNGNGQATYISGLWNSTAAVTSISFTIGGSGINWNANSSFALYGIKG